MIPSRPLVGCSKLSQATMREEDLSGSVPQAPNAGILIKGQERDLHCDV